MLEECENQCHFSQCCIFEAWWEFLATSLLTVSAHARIVCAFSDEWLFDKFAAMILFKQDLGKDKKQLKNKMHSMLLCRLIKGTPTQKGNYKLKKSVSCILSKEVTKRKLKQTPSYPVILYIHKILIVAVFPLTKQMPICSKPGSI